MTAEDRREADLATTADPLAVALTAVKPIPANAAEDCQACRRALLIEADQHLAPTARRSDREIARVLSILDEIELERTDRA